MAKTENEIKIIISSDERNNLKSAIEKLTEKKVGFNMPTLTEDEDKIINFIKLDL
jgi:pyruvate formate-lyase activating enzyme-like uncharacterized protein